MLVLAQFVFFTVAGLRNEVVVNRLVMVMGFNASWLTGSKY